MIQLGQSSQSDAPLMTQARDGVVQDHRTQRELLRTSQLKSFVKWAAAGDYRRAHLRWHTGCMAPQVASQAELMRSTQRRARPRRDLKAMEERRMRAADLFRKEVIPAEVARQLGVSHQVVSDWRKVWRQG